MRTLLHTRRIENELSANAELGFRALSKIDRILYIMTNRSVV